MLKPQNMVFPGKAEHIVRMGDMGGMPELHPVMPKHEVGMAQGAEQTKEFGNFEHNADSFRPTTELGSQAANPDIQNLDRILPVEGVAPEARPAHEKIQDPEAIRQFNEVMSGKRNPLDTDKVAPADYIAGLNGDI